MPDVKELEEKDPAQDRVVGIDKRGRAKLVDAGLKDYEGLEPVDTGFGGKEDFDTTEYATPEPESFTPHIEADDYERLDAFVDALAEADWGEPDDSDEIPDWVHAEAEVRPWEVDDEPDAALDAADLLGQGQDEYQKDDRRQELEDRRKERKEQAEKDTWSNLSTGSKQVAVAAYNALLEQRRNLTAANSALADAVETTPTASASQVLMDECAQLEGTPPNSRTRLAQARRILAIVDAKPGLLSPADAPRQGSPEIALPAAASPVPRPSFERPKVALATIQPPPRARHRPAAHPFFRRGELARAR